MTDWDSRACKDCVYARKVEYGFYCELLHIWVGDTDACTHFKPRRRGESQDENKNESSNL